MRLFLRESSAGRRHTADQAVFRLTEQRQQAAQLRREEKERLRAERQAERERKQEAERQAIRERQKEVERQAEREQKKEEEYQAAKERQQEAQHQAEKWKAVAADYKESLEQYELGYQQILENLKKLQEQQDSISILKEQQEYILKNFPTLEANIVDRLKGEQTGSIREIMNCLERMVRTQRRNNLWTKILLWISFLCSGAALGGMIVLLLYFTDRIAL